MTWKVKCVCLTCIDFEGQQGATACVHTEVYLENIHLLCDLSTQVHEKGIKFVL